MKQSLTQPSDAVREVVGMRRWLRLTARKTKTPRTPSATSGNPAADAAAVALAGVLKDARKRA